MSEELTDARTEAITEIVSAMLKSAGEALSRHGNDPYSGPILLAATAMFVGRIDREIEHGFQQDVVAMLSKKSK